MNRILTEKNYKDVASDLGIEVEAIKAVAEVESNGSGFLPNGYPKILFEGHLFHKFTGGKFDATEPTISYPKWTKEYYLGGVNEYRRLHIAAALDHTAALKATSWGKFQILGANYYDAGYEKISLFVHEMHETEANHLKAFVNIIRSWNLVDALKYHKWDIFARKYNGSNYKQNNYDVKIARAYNRMKLK